MLRTRISRRPLLLIVLDGWGHREATEYNAIARSAPFFASALGRYPNTLLSASGREVGLPLGLMGNSEVGHTNMGAGRVVYQDITRIDKSIEDGDFFENGALVRALETARRDGKRVHLLGLVSDGGVHSSDQHVRALLELAKRHGLAGDQVAIHAILDGRDTPPRSARGYVERLERNVLETGVGVIASVVGRYFAMDRDHRWERVRKAYDLFVGGVGERIGSAQDAIDRSYAANKGDEFFEPFVVGDPTRNRIANGDQVVCFNFRADRMREICSALAFDDFEGFPRSSRTRPTITTFTQYRDDFPFAIAYPPAKLSGIFPELISEAGLRQERIAETEKYAHVTFFFSGGREREYAGESRTLVPSPRVATYDMKPEMSAFEVRDAILASLEKGDTDVYVINFANADMVGHTGDFEAACKAVAAVDLCLSQIVPRVVAKGGVATITADHGNAEMLWDEINDQPHTAHTTNPVPIVFCGDGLQGVKLRPMGILADVAPTLLKIGGMPQPVAMDGKSLIV